LGRFASAGTGRHESSANGRTKFLVRMRIESRPTSPLPEMVVNEIHVQQVVLNLLRNTMEAIRLRMNPDLSSEWVP
jgi:nitrogen-specific signal transduction histidine kinase